MFARCFWWPLISSFSSEVATAGGSGGTGAGGPARLRKTHARPVYHGASGFGGGRMRPQEAPPPDAGREVDRRARPEPEDDEPDRPRRREKQPLRAARDAKSPRESHGEEAIGEVDYRCGDADEVDERHDGNTSLRGRKVGRQRRIEGVGAHSAEELGNSKLPQVVEDERERDEPRCPLQRVEPVPRERISHDVRTP